MSFVWINARKSTLKSSQMDKIRWNIFSVPYIQMHGAAWLASCPCAWSQLLSIFVGKIPGNSVKSLCLYCCEYRSTQKPYHNRESWDPVSHVNGQTNTDFPWVKHTEACIVWPNAPVAEWEQILIYSLCCHQLEKNVWPFLCWMFGAALCSVSLLLSSGFPVFWTVLTLSLMHFYPLLPV